MAPKLAYQLSAQLSVLEANIILGGLDAPVYINGTLYTMEELVKLANDALAAGNPTQMQAALDLLVQINSGSFAGYVQKECIVAY